MLKNVSCAWPMLVIPYPPRPPDLYGRNGRLYANEQELFIRGINWWGAEGVWRMPFGLLERSVEDYLGFMQRYGFNAWRLMFSWEAWVKDEPIPPAHFSRTRNPRLVGTTYRTMLTHLVRQAAKRGILVLLACHRIRIAYNTNNGNNIHAEWPGDWDGLWYDDGYPEARIERLWDEVTAHFCGEWNTMGVDLMNEPYSASWGDASGRDWRRGATRMGNAALRGCRRWLVIVQGTSNPGMFGENLIGVQPNGEGEWFDGGAGSSATGMVGLSNLSKLVYSAQYGEMPLELAPLRHRLLCPRGRRRLLLLLHDTLRTSALSCSPPCHPRLLPAQLVRPLPLSARRRRAARVPCSRLPTRQHARPLGGKIPLMMMMMMMLMVMMMMTR